MVYDVFFANLSKVEIDFEFQFHNQMVYYEYICSLLFPYSLALCIFQYYSGFSVSFLIHSCRLGLPPIANVKGGFSPLLEVWGKGANRIPILVQFQYPLSWVVTLPSNDVNGEDGTVQAGDYAKGDTATFFVYDDPGNVKVRQLFLCLCYYFWMFLHLIISYFFSRFELVLELIPTQYKTLRSYHTTIQLHPVTNQNQMYLSKPKS